MSSVTRICFVCLGNIVRSPLAKSLFLYHANQAGRGDLYEVDSAATSGWHVGESPDPRMRRVSARHGVPLDGRARQFKKPDFERFDLILVMDGENYSNLRRLGPSPEQLQKVHFLRDFEPSGGSRLEVPDPYYAGIDGFETVFEIIDRSVRGLLDVLENNTPVKRR